MKQKESKHQKQNTYTGPFILVFFITGLVGGMFLVGSANKQLSDHGTVSAIVFCLLLQLEFFIWFLFQVYDFRNKKLMQPSFGVKIFTTFFLLMMSIGGGMLGIITALILFICIALQIFFWIMLLIRKLL